MFDKILSHLSRIDQKLYFRFRDNNCCRYLYDYFDNPSNTLSVNENPDMYISSLRKSASRFNKVVLWGLRTKYHTHRFIYLGYYNTLRECGINVVWVDDIEKNNDIVDTNDIVFVVGICAEKIKYKKNVYYVLHNVENEFEGANKYLLLHVYTNYIESQGKVLHDKTTIYDSSTRTLYQVWGTDVPPYRFAPPPPVFWNF